MTPNRDQLACLRAAILRDLDRVDKWVMKFNRKSCMRVPGSSEVRLLPGKWD